MLLKVAQMLGQTEMKERDLGLRIKKITLPLTKSLILLPKICFGGITQEWSFLTTLCSLQAGVPGWKGLMVGFVLTDT